jgi:thiamine-monophosphate kinase
MKEFEQIKRYFSKPPTRRDVLLGVGDDCAIVNSPEGKQLAISCDTMVEDVHFFKTMPARALAHKLVASNLSDLAAMGAVPAWITLSMSMPEMDAPWLETFSAALHEITDYYGMNLIGGDTTYSPIMVLSVTIHGFLPSGKGMRRSGAGLGDFIYVTGYLGDAALGLQHLKQAKELSPLQIAYAVERHYYPTPRVLLGQSIRDVVTSCTDLSDGLSIDLPQLLEASGHGGQIHLDKLPLSKVMQQACSIEQAFDLALHGGEDYELLFTAPANQRMLVEASAQDADVKITCIGQVQGAQTLQYIYHNQPWDVTVSGYEHFKT